MVFFDECEKAVAPYLPYSPASDTETELGEATPSLSRSNSSASSNASDERPKLKREYAFYGNESWFGHFGDKNRINKRRHSPVLDSDTERELKRIVLSDD